MAGCCGGGKVNIPSDQQKIVDAVKKKENYTPNTGVKSNRTPAGTIAKQCPQCGTKSTGNSCPICHFKYI